MARQARWNKSFWKKMNHLENLEQIADKPMLQIIQEEVNYVDSIMIVDTPYRFGGLLESHYAEVVETPHGYSGRVGYKRTQHKNLDPNLEPGECMYDEETNPEVMEYLSTHPKREAQVGIIEDAMERYPENCKKRIKEWFKSEIKNGGK